MEKTTTFHNQKMHYKIVGQGNTLVLLHGFMEDMSMWEAHISALSKFYQVLTIDLPGHGKSAYISDNHSMELMAEVVFQILEEEKIEKCVMIGHSMGGYVTLSFAEKYPQKLKGFGLFHSHSLSDTEEAKKNRERTIELVRKQKVAFINEFIPSLFAEKNREIFKAEIRQQIEKANQMDGMGIIAALAGMKDRTSKLDIIAFSNVPVLFILGKKDIRIPLEKAMAQASSSRFSQINILGDSGHMGWLEEQEKTIKIIHGFMNVCF